MVICIFVFLCSSWKVVLDCGVVTGYFVVYDFYISWHLLTIKPKQINVMHLTDCFFILFCLNVKITKEISHIKYTGKYTPDPVTSGKLCYEFGTYLQVTQGQLRMGKTAQIKLQQQLSLHVEIVSIVECRVHMFFTDAFAQSHLSLIYVSGCHLHLQAFYGPKSAHYSSHLQFTKLAVTKQPSSVPTLYYTVIKARV